MNNNDGLLPSDPDAEIGVLECCLADPSAINRAKKIIGPDDFSKNGGKELFQHLLSFHNSDRGFTPYSLIKSFEDRPDSQHYKDLIDSLQPITGEAVSYYAEIVLETSNRRKLIKAFDDYGRELYDIAVDPKEIIINIKSVITDVEKRINANE